MGMGGGVDVGAQAHEFGVDRPFAVGLAVARKLAAVRGLYGFLVRTERAGQNPAELVSSPKRSEQLPKVLTVEQLRVLLERIPARTPLELRDLYDQPPAGQAQTGRLTLDDIMAELRRPGRLGLPWV